MEDEFKSLKFRHQGKTYTAKAVDIHGPQMVSGNFMSDIALFRIFDENEKEMLGGIVFRKSSFLKYLDADPKRNQFPQNEYLEEALINLLHYLPFYPEKLKPLYAEQGTCFIYQFVRDKDDGLENEKNYNIKTEGSFESTFFRLMFGEEATTETIQFALLEPLYLHWKDDSLTGTRIEQIVSIVPLKRNAINANLELLEDDGFVEIIRDTSGNFISVKLKPRGVKKVEGSLQADVQSTPVTNYHYGNKINVKTGDYSPVIINADIIDSFFGNIERDLEKKNPENKVELTEAINSLKQEFKKDNKDQGKIQKALNVLKNGGVWIYDKVLNNQLVGSLLAQLALQQMGLTSP